MESDACYFRKRAEEEFAAAKKAGCDQSRAAHFEMAERYAQLAAAIDAVDEQIGTVAIREVGPASDRIDIAASRRLQ
jgi:flagellar biosynthesis/type III secretory pathway protein FliH